MARDTNERVAVASAAIDLIGAVSGGAPRPADITCDRVVAEEPVFVPVAPMAAPVGQTTSTVRRALQRDWLRMAGLALLAMTVVLIAGLIALSAQRPRTATTPPSPGARAVTHSTGTRARQESSASASMWVVQVGAFLNHDRSQSLVQRLTRFGFPTFEISRAAPNGRLNVVRVGPFRAASEADDARARLRGLAEIEDAFVRSVTSIP
jgi:hypothetical protein